MLKKLKMLGLLVFCGGILTGCVQMVEMTSQENNMIAESMADLLLKYDKNHEEDLIYQESKDLRAQLQAQSETTSETGGITTTSNGENKNITSNDNSNKGGLVTTSTIDEADPIAYTTLNNVFGKNKFQVDYKKYEIKDSYHGNISNQSFAIDPADNKQLLVVYFDITNLSKESKNLNLAKAGIKYQMKIGEDSFYPLMTLLLNDIQYINLDFAVDETKEAVLLFEIPKNVDLSKLELAVGKKNNIAVINIK